MEEKEIKRELDILMKLDHPHVVKLICYTKKLYRTLIAFEFMTYGDLLHNLRASARYVSSSYNLYYSVCLRYYWSHCDHC